MVLERLRLDDKAPVTTAALKASPRLGHALTGEQLLANDGHYVTIAVVTAALAGLL